MGVPMAKAVFTKEFHWGRKKSNIGFGAKPGPKVQVFPRDFIEAAIAAGAAHKPVDQTKEKTGKRG